MKNVCLFLSLIVFPTLAWSQCKNADFNNSSFWGWTATGGERWYYNAYTPSGLVTGSPPLAITDGPIRHQIINIGTGPLVFDPRTCGTVATTPPGKAISAKLGNEIAGSQYDVLEYTFSITPSSNLILYSFASIFQETSPTPGGGHSNIEQPTFIVNLIEESTGSLINLGNPSCAADTFFSQFSDPLLRYCNYPPAAPYPHIYYRGWTTVGVDVSAYQNLAFPNNQITLQFITYDCAQGGHFGYAYVSAECGKLEIQVEYCQNQNQAILTAPEGFNYVWSNGATSQTIIWPNPVPGQLVSVDLETKGGCVSTLQTTLQPTNIAANFSFQDVCIGTDVVFNDLSTASDALGNTLALSYFSWDFGDGSPISNVQNPNHTYANPGSYQVTFVCETGNGCQDTMVKTVNVWPAPVADFNFSGACVGSNIDFLDASSISSGTVSSWSWNFDDSTTFTSPSNLSNMQNPSYTYDSIGTYYPQLIVVSDHGCRDTIEKPITIQNLPVASYTYTGPCVGQNTIFQDASIPNSGVIQSWLWNFGDGANAISQNPQHAFGASVDYLVHLVVTNSFGCIDDTTMTISILSVEADFSTDTSCFEQVTEFLDQSVGNIAAWNWTFGPGLTSSSQFPTHVFDLPGNHIITLQVASAEGCIKSVTKNVYVFEKPVVNFVADIYEGCPELCVQFTDFSTCADNIVSWAWGVDSNFYQTQNPTHCFTDSGYKDVYLTVMTNKGCFDTLSLNDLIHVYSNPTAAFSFTPLEVYVNNPEVTFTNESVGADSYQWTYDYLGTSNVFDTTILFPLDNPYFYNVCLKAIATNGCEDTTCATVPSLGIFDFYAANTFTPNKDGVNDTFKPVIVGADSSFYEFFVFTRWGQLIFYTQDYNLGWDGKVNGEVVKDDVYVWEIKTRELSSGEYRNYFGHILALIFKK